MRVLGVPATLETLEAPRQGGESRHVRCSLAGGRGGVYSEPYISRCGGIYSRNMRPMPRTTPVPHVHESTTWPGAQESPPCPSAALSLCMLCIASAPILGHSSCGGNSRHLSYSPVQRPAAVAGSRLQLRPERNQSLAPRYVPARRRHVQGRVSRCRHSGNHGACRREHARHTAAQRHTQRYHCFQGC